MTYSEVVFIIDACADQFIPVHDGKMLYHTCTGWKVSVAQTVPWDSMPKLIDALHGSGRRLTAAYQHRLRPIVLEAQGMN